MYLENVKNKIKKRKIMMVVMMRVMMRVMVMVVLVMMMTTVNYEKYTVNISVYPSSLGKVNLRQTSVLSLGCFSTLLIALFN